MARSSRAPLPASCAILPLSFMLLSPVVSIAFFLAAAPDCAPLSHMPGFEAQQGADAQLRDYDFHDYHQDSGSPPVRVKGRTCSSRFLLKAGTTEPPPAEIVRYYKAEMEKLGAKVLRADTCEIISVLKKSGAETWLNAKCDGGWGSVYDVIVTEVAPFKPTLTAPSAGDTKWLGHMPGYTVIMDETTEETDDDFPVSPEMPPLKVQGKRHRLAYRATARPQPSSDIETIDNYALAMQKLGWQVVYRSEKDLTARFEDGAQTWVRVQSLFGEITMDVLEEKPFQAVVPQPKKDVLKTALDQDGHVALYINFDFAKATLKPDAGPVIAQVLALMKDNLTYKLKVEGHTDNVGEAAPNQKLSEARAATVVAELVKGGIAAARLSSSGAGLTKPIADNATSEGRAKNRRVELVK